MEFWGVEVKNGESLKVGPGADRILHISQASLGEAKKDKGSEPIYLYLNFKNQKFVLATLSHENFPQAPLDVVLEKDFELSHSWKNGSVYFSGYKIEVEDEYSDTEEEEEHPLTLDVRGKSKEAKAGEAKSDTAVKHVNFKEPNKDAKTKQEDNSSDDDEDDDEDEDMSSDEESSDDQAPVANGGDESTESSDSDDDSESSDDETPKKPESSKKRPSESAVKTPVADKKATFSTPQKTDGKKGGVHIATPHPSKQAGKKPAKSEQTKQQTPKSAGSHSCKSCNRSFTSETGLQSHNKAKHGTEA